MVLEDVEDPSSDGSMGLKKISTTSVLETGKISPLTVPVGGVVLSRPRPALDCSAHDDDDDDDDVDDDDDEGSLPCSQEPATLSYSELH
jgi:hypothetical protein